MKHSFSVHVPRTHFGIAFQQQLDNVVLAIHYLETQKTPFRSGHPYKPDLESYSSKQTGMLLSIDQIWISATLEEHLHAFSVISRYGKH